ncbi:MAG TPA: hypothetical protein VJL59_11900, partial [Anaerolineales bacterium]|nr:hypothetical protein [Anaerolineales bacterium]
MPIRLAAHLLIAAFLLMGALGLQPSQIALAERSAGEHGGRSGRPLLLPIASVTLNVPANVQIGQAFSFTATFDNTDVDEAGYGPFIDIVFPVIGADGAGAQADDGIDFVSATYLGAPVTAVQQTFGAANTGGCAGGLGPASHPYAIDNTNTPLLVCGTPGNKLVTLQLPFGSFTPDQPPAVVTVNAILSNLADVGTPLTLRARSGYQYGATPTNDWCCGDVSIVSHSGASTGWPGSPVTPTLLSLTKTYSGPEDETATGPNYPRQYTLTVDIATGQPVTNLTVTDTLPGNMQFVSVASTVPAATCTTPGTTTPGGTLNCNFGTVTGGATASDATLTFNFFIPLNNAGGSPVINAATGDDVTSVNTSSVTGSWDPIDGRDPITPVSAGGVCPTGCHTLTDKSIAIQKSVATAVDVGVTGNSPGDTLQYALTFQISDFFSFEDVVITDVISDGQRVDAGFTPTLQVNGNGFTSAAADMNAANYAVVVNADNNPATPATDGSSILTFRVSDELITRGESGRLIGGCIPVAGTSGPDPDCGVYNNNATMGTIVFRAIIQQDFTDTYPSGDSSVDHGDILADDVTINGDLLSVTDNTTPTGSSETDDSAA